MRNKDLIKKRKWLSDIVGEQYRYWINEAKRYFVFFEAGCGAGKTFFLLRVLLPELISQGKKILILVPRKSLRKKYVMDLVDVMVKSNITQDEMCKFVFVMTYQELEQRRCEGCSIPAYDVCVVEEASYFFDDATFNPRTQVSYDWLIGEGCADLNIWISATGDRVFTKVKNDLQLNPRITEVDTNTGLSCTVKRGYYNTYEEYDTERDYSWVDVKYLESNFDICDLVHEAPKEKWVIFCDSKKKGKEYLEKLKEKKYSVAFLNADNIEEEDELVNCIASIDKFQQQILITTAVIESGNEFKELELKNIVLLCSTKSRFIQMASRRRRQNNDDRITLYIVKRDYIFFEWNLRNVMDRLNKYADGIFQKISSATDVIKNVVETKRYDELLFSFLALDDGSLSINHLLLGELIYQRDFYKEMCVAIREDENAFIKCQLSWLGLMENFCPENHINGSIIDAVKEEIIARVREMEQTASEYTHEEASDFVKSLIPLVEKVDKTVTKGGMALPKFEKFCKAYNLACEWDSFVRDKKKYYIFRTWDTGAVITHEEGKDDM